MKTCTRIEYSFPDRLHSTHICLRAYVCCRQKHKRPHCFGRWLSTSGRVSHRQHRVHLVAEIGALRSHCFWEVCSGLPQVTVLGDFGLHGLSTLLWTFTCNTKGIANEAIAYVQGEECRYLHLTKLCYHHGVSVSYTCFSYFF